MQKEWHKDTSLKWKRKKDIESLVFNVANWCMHNLPSNEKLPKVWVDWKRQKRCYGEYDYTDNEIIVYPLIHEKVEDIIDTTIHEWIHFLQDNNEIIEKEETYKFYKSANPIELEAVELAKKYTKKCIKDIYKNGKLHFIS
jgi:hypothetical protein|tara:strand:- start:31 stop:453 length:423 start_codon:yes stop_codon:yes gene_type:complete